MNDTLSNVILAMAQQGVGHGAVLAPAAQPSHLVANLTIFALAVFLGYYVVWKVTPALHSPLMAVTNAISSVIVVGAIIATGVAAFRVDHFQASQVFGFVAVMLAAVNIFGGFVITGRMLSKFKKKDKPTPAALKKA